MLKNIIFFTVAILLEWGVFINSNQEDIHASSGQKVSRSKDCTLADIVVAVVQDPQHVENRKRRKLIRQTWASSLPPIICCFFVARNPLAMMTSDPGGQTLLKESLAHGDLLFASIKDQGPGITSDAEFLKLELAQFSQILTYNFTWLVLVDDKTYVDGKQLQSFLEFQDDSAGFYGGNLLPAKPNTLNDLHSPLWPLSHHLPFAELPIVISRNLVDFIDYNSNTLSALVPKMEMALSIWLLALGQHPQDLEAISSYGDHCVQNTFALTRIPNLEDFLQIHHKVLEHGNLCAFASNKNQEFKDTDEVRTSTSGDMQDPPTVSILNPVSGTEINSDSTILEVEVMGHHISSYDICVLLVRKLNESPQCFGMDNFPLEISGLRHGSWVIEVSLKDRSSEAIVSVVHTSIIVSYLTDEVLQASLKAKALLGEHHHSFGLKLPQPSELYSQTQKRVAVLSNDFNAANTQARIWRALALEIPRDQFYIEGFGIFADMEFLQSMANALVSVHLMDCLKQFDFAVTVTQLTSATYLDQVDPDVSSCLMPYYQRLRTFDVALFPNSLDDQGGRILQELARLSTQDGLGPVMVMDLPNVNPPEGTAVHALVAPSLYAAAMTFPLLKDASDTVPLRVIHPMISGIKYVDDSSIADRWSHEKNTFTIGTLSRISGEINWGGFLLMSRYIHRRLPNVRFWIAGDGPHKSYAEKLAKDLNVPVEFLGQLEGNEKEGFFQGIDLLVRPILCETFGLASIEARARGVPVLGFELCGQIEGIGIGGGGVLVDIQNSTSPFQELAQEAIKIALDSSYRKEILQRDATIFEELFSMHAFVQSYTKLLNQLVVWHHGFPRGEPDWLPEVPKQQLSPTLLIGHSPSAIFSVSFLESLFGSLLSNFNIKVELVPRVQPVIFVTSVLDGGCGDSWELRCSRHLKAYLELYPNSLHILLSGEPWDTSSAPFNPASGVNLVLHTSSDPNLIPCSAQQGNMHRCLHLPNFVTAFSEMNRHSYTDLLGAKNTTLLRHKQDEIIKGQARAAYMYSRCDRPMREQFFDALSQVMPVDALGACQGLSSPMRPERLGGRYADSNWHDTAVEMYQQYQFVVAFENTIASGYITEKIITAMLSGAVPIYYGSSSVSTFFNSDSFIDCTKITSPVDCANKVAAYYIHENNRSTLKYMLNQPWIIDSHENSFLSFFESMRTGSIHRKVFQVLWEQWSEKYNN